MHITFLHIYILDSYFSFAGIAELGGGNQGIDDTDLGSRSDSKCQSNINVNVTGKLLRSDNFNDNCKSLD